MFCIVLLLCGCKSNDLNNDDNVNENQTDNREVQPALGEFDFSSEE